MVSPVTSPGSCSGACPVHAGPAHRHDSAGPAESSDTMAPGMSLGCRWVPRHVGQVGRPDHPYSQVGQPTPGRRQVGNLEQRHVPALAATPRQVPPGPVSGLRGRHHLDEGVASREYRVSQAELAHPRIVEGRRPAERPAKLAGHQAAVARHHGHLAQAGSGQHISNTRAH